VEFCPPLKQPNLARGLTLDISWGPPSTNKNPAAVVLSGAFRTSKIPAAIPWFRDPNAAAACPPTPPLDVLAAVQRHRGGVGIVLMPFRRQQVVRRDGLATAEGLAGDALAGGAGDLPAVESEVADPDVSLVHLPAGRAAGALQPHPLVAGAGVVLGVQAAVFGGVPPLGDAGVVGQGVLPGGLLGFSDACKGRADDHGQAKDAWRLSGHSHARVQCKQASTHCADGSCQRTIKSQ